MRPDAHGAPAVTGDEDSWSWLITFSDLVLQLFGFAIIAAVGGAATGLVARDVAPAAEVAAVAPQESAGAAASTASRDGEPGVSSVPVAAHASAGQSEMALASGDVLPARGSHDSDRDALPSAPQPIAPGASGVLPASTSITSAAPLALTAPTTAPAVTRDEELHALGRYLEHLAAREPALAATVSVHDDGVVVRIGELAGFAPASAEPAPAMRPLIGELRALLAASPGLHAEVTGHTDDRPIQTAAFPSNLELSLARASRVAQELTGGDAALRARVSAAGYGEQRPVASNDSAEGRARNRRVEVRLSRAG